MNKQKLTDALTALETSTQLHKDAIGYSQRAIEQNQLAVKLLIEAAEETKLTVDEDKTTIQVNGKYTFLDDSGLHVFGTSDAYRKHIVELAKEEVAGLDDYEIKTTLPFKDEDIVSINDNGVVRKESIEMDDVFHVNKEKRTVVYLAKGKQSKHVYFRGVAKCHESDTFNEHIGKVIAFYKAAGEEVPEIFTTVPNPEKAKAGDIVQWWEKNKFYKVNDISEKFDYDLYYINEDRHCGNIPYESENEFMERVHKIFDDSDRK